MPLNCATRPLFSSLFIGLTASCPVSSVHCPHPHPLYMRRTRKPLAPVSPVLCIRQVQPAGELVLQQSPAQRLHVLTDVGQSAAQVVNLAHQISWERTAAIHQRKRGAVRFHPLAMCIGHTSPKVPAHRRSRLAFISTSADTGAIYRAGTRLTDRDTTYRAGTRLTDRDVTYRARTRLTDRDAT